MLICCVRINYEPVVSLPSKCFKIERIVKENKEKIVFVAKGKSNVLFTLNITEKDMGFYHANDLIEYKGRLMPLPAPKSLNGFIYADYLCKTGVDSIAYPKSFPRLVYRDSLSIHSYTSRFKKSITSYLLNFSKITDFTKGFMIALLTGDKSFLDKKGYNLFRESGVIHVLAVSGLHVGILYATLYFLFSKILRLHAKMVFHIIAVLLIGYAFISGLSPSVIRAVIMFTLIQFGKSYQKTTNTLNIVFSSAFLMLFYEPSLMFDIGFQLSYSAVIGIVFIMQYSGLKRLVKNKYFSLLWNLVLVNFAAFLFTTPVIAYHFGVINFTSIWASLLVVPIITLVMYLGLLLLVISINYSFAEKVYLILDYIFTGLSSLLNLIIDNLNLTFHFFMGGSGVIIFFSILFCAIIRKLRWMFFIILFNGLIFCFPKAQKLQFLKLTDQVQLKYRGEILEIKKGDSLRLNDVTILCKELRLIEVHKLQTIKTIDFNVNNYKSLILEF